MLPGASGALGPPRVPLPLHLASRLSQPLPALPSKHPVSDFSQAHCCHPDPAAAPSAGHPDLCRHCQCSSREHAGTPNGPPCSEEASSSPRPLRPQELAPMASDLPVGQPHHTPPLRPPLTPACASRFPQMVSQPAPTLRSPRRRPSMPPSQASLLTTPDMSSLFRVPRYTLHPSWCK